jgi:hypothetical protein
MLAVVYIYRKYYLVCRCICTEEREVRAGEEDVNERCEGLRGEGESTKEMGVYKWEVTGGGLVGERC